MNFDNKTGQTRIITGPPVQNGEWTLRTQTKLITRQTRETVRMQQRPVAVLVNNSLETKYLPVPDITRMVQTALLGGCMALFLIIKLLKLKQGSKNHGKTK